MSSLVEIFRNYVIWQRIKKQNSEANRNKIIAAWIREGRQIPPPHEVKQEAIRKYQKEYSAKVLVETGTFRGEMVYAQRSYFDRIISIELSEELYKIVKKRLGRLQNVELLNGDSAELLGEVVKGLDQQAIFWLDGHYSGFETAKGKVETPVNRELDAIFESGLDHIILIDDARMFRGENDYPTIQQVEDKVRSKTNNYIFKVEDDIIRILPGISRK
jgi:hypothetical protein